MTGNTQDNPDIDNTLIIRPIRETELEKAFTVESACYSAETAATFEAFRYRHEAYPGFFLSAWHNGRMAGIANGILTDRTDCSGDDMKHKQPDSAGGRNLCILTVAVPEDWRRRGIGSQLVSHLLGEARQQGLDRVILICERHLIPFYERLGFRWAGPSKSRHGGVSWHEMFMATGNRPAER